MLAKRIIPTLLTRGNQLIKGQCFDSWRSIGVAMQAAKIHATRSVDELIVLDISATPEGRGPNLKMVEELTKNCFIPVTIGGGVRSIEDVRDLLNAGADKVAICSAALDHGEKDGSTVPGFVLLQEASAKFGAQAIVAGIDVYTEVWGMPNYATKTVDPVLTHLVATQCGKRRYMKTPVSLAGSFAENGAGEIMLTSIGRDGTMQGYDLELIKSVSDAVNIPVIASGGCKSYDDMYDAFKAGADACAAGALFAFTDATPRGAAEYLSKKGIICRM